MRGLFVLARKRTIQSLRQRVPVRNEHRIVSHNPNLQSPSRIQIHRIKSRKAQSLKLYLPVTSKITSLPGCGFLCGRCFFLIFDFYVSMRPTLRDLRRGEQLIDAPFDRGVFRAFERRVGAQQLFRRFADNAQHLRVAQDVRNVQFGKPVLAFAEEIARPAQLQIGVGDPKAVGRLAKNFESRGRFFVLRIRHQNTGRFFFAAPHSAAQLVQLGEAEAFRSAFSMSITFAFGTSTPTSMTTVETSMSISPFAKARITASFSRGRIRPCKSPSRRDANTPFCRRS